MFYNYSKCSYIVSCKAYWHQISGRANLHQGMRLRKQSLKISMIPLKSSPINIPKVPPITPTTFMRSMITYSSYKIVLIGMGNSQRKVIHLFLFSFSCITFDVYLRIEHDCLHPKEAFFSKLKAVMYTEHADSWDIFLSPCLIFNLVFFPFFFFLSSIGQRMAKNIYTYIQDSFILVQTRKHARPLFCIF